ncbi:MAG: hypothetical protein Q7S56_00405, partial [Nanoarchaeota archaeon]|nr:hypothetical protein [Nanoarchaeota archaeon]
MQKRDKIVLISAVIVLSIILLFKLSFLQGLPLSPVNYISNPGFNGSSEWSFGYEPGNGTVNVVNNQLKITRYGFVFQRPAILNNHNGENFTLSFWAKKEDSNVIAYAGIQGYPSWYTDPSRIAKIDSTEWKQYFLNFNTNQINSKDNIFQVVLATDHSNQGTVWFEDIYLSKSVDTTFCQSHTVYSSPSPVPNQGCCFPTAKSFNNKSINGAAMPSNNIILAIPGDISTLNTYLCYNGQIFYRLSNQTYYWTTYKPTCSIVGNYYASQTGKYGEWKQGDGNGVDIGDGKVCDGNGEIKLIKDFQVEDNPTNNQSNDIPNNDQFNDTSTNDSVDIPYENPNGKIWYVRPLASNGLYGNGDGSSYDNAWNGLKNVLWGDNGVKAGDSLYVCGTNVYKTNSMNNIADQANIVIGASGTSEKPITIRMDCSNKNQVYKDGEVWGIFGDNVGGPAIWNGPDTNGVYWTSDLSLNWGKPLVEFNGLNYLVLNKSNSTTWLGNKGALFV